MSNRDVRGGIGALVCLVALSFLFPALARGGTEAQIKLEQAKVQFSAQNYQEALGLLDAVVAEEPENAEAYHYAGLCQLGLDKPEAAIPLLTKAAELKPGDAGALEDLAWAQVMSGKLDDAIASADRALGVNPSSEPATLYKAQALMGQNKFGEAKPLLQKLEGSATYGQAALYYEGICAANLGQMDQAGGYFQRAAALGPDTELGKKAAANVSALEAGGVAGQAKPWSVRVRLLYQYDTNIVPVNNEDFLPEDVSHQEDGRAVLDLDARYKFVDTAEGNAYVRYGGYSNWQFRENSLNIMYHRGELGGSRDLKAGPTVIRVGAKAWYMVNYLDGDLYSNNWQATPEATFIWSRELRTRLTVDEAGETFDDPGEDDNDRDNTRTIVSIQQHFFLADGKVNTWIGYGYGAVNASGDNYNRVDNLGHAGLMASLPRKSVAALIYRYEYRDYPDSAFDRREVRNTVNASLQVPVYKQLSAYASVVYMSVDANLEQLEYERWIYTLGMMADF
ncbi:MAG TPA: tetratricopeptide repeat protein [bacterium]|nr:tetratricopeptide repeat protein [bacterium]